MAMSNKELQSMLEQMQAQMATLQAEKAAMQAERDAAIAKASKPRASRTELPEIFGHSATAIMRALVGLGADATDVNRALVSLWYKDGAFTVASPSGIVTQCARASAWFGADDAKRSSDKAIKAGKPAELTATQARELCRHAGIEAPATLPAFIKADETPAPTTTPTAS